MYHLILFGFFLNLTVSNFDSCNKVGISLNEKINTDFLQHICWLPNIHNGCFTYHKEINFLFLSARSEWILIARFH